MKKRVYLIAVIGILLDQMSKILACQFLTDVEVIPNFFHLTYVKNTGGAWGILENNMVILICVSVLTLFVIYKYMNSGVEISPLSSISYGLLIGGIFGNLLDRIFRGFVIDFLNFNIYGYHFPVFNFADSFIVIGVIFMLIEVIGGFHGNKSRDK